MQGLSDEQQMERLERKVDDGFLRLETKIDDGLAAMRAEFRSESGAIRAELGALARATYWGIIGLFGTMILGFAGIIIAMLAHG
ncbi:MAG: hypothetical protein JSS68_19765 [Actinobacteria bacterium]|nr:hypothetical protein [Actinomycetota bacterium]MBS1884315.1 hypothetical protein [Actinomycetota bacterium]